MRPEVRKSLEKQAHIPEYRAILNGYALVESCEADIKAAMKDKGISDKEMAKRMQLPLHYWKSLIEDNCMGVRILGEIFSHLDMCVTITVS